MAKVKAREKSGDFSPLRQTIDFPLLAIIVAEPPRTRLIVMFFVEPLGSCDLSLEVIAAVAVDNLTGVNVVSGMSVIHHSNNSFSFGVCSPLSDYRIPHSWLFVNSFL
jgi:hypothetical protein